MDKLQNCLFVDMERHAAGDNVAVRTKRKEEKRERRDSKTNAAAAEN